MFRLARLSLGHDVSYGPADSNSANGFFQSTAVQYAFCKRCIETKMTFQRGIYCSACMQRSSHQIHYSGSMEVGIFQEDIKKVLFQRLSHSILMGFMGFVNFVDRRNFNYEKGKLTTLWIPLR